MDNKYMTYRRLNGVFPNHPRGPMYLFDSVYKQSIYNMSTQPLYLDINGNVVSTYIPEAGIAYGQKWRFLN